MLINGPPTNEVCRALDRTLAGECSHTGAVAAPFRPNEFAYLALTQKIEHAIRDRLAFSLHEALAGDPSLLVCREWFRRDLAVVQADKPRLILEAKAIYTFDIINEGAEHPFPRLVADDLAKAAEWASDAPESHPLETLALVVATHPHSQPGRQYKQAVKYFGGVSRYASESLSFDEASERLSQRMGAFRQVHGVPAFAGTAFGIDVSIYAWLFAPR